MIIERFVVGMLQTNCYLLGDSETRTAVVIDPGGESGRIARRIGELDLKLVAILNTHGHFDHIMEAWALKELLNGSVYLHPRDVPLLDDPMVGLGAIRMAKSHSQAYEVDQLLHGGDHLELGPIELEVIETPGHTPGHVSFYCADANALFVGDTLFAGSIGRTDFPGGSFDQLIHSVRSKIFPLSGEAIVYPGHGPETTVERERRTNPFFR